MATSIKLSGKITAAALHRLTRDGSDVARFDIDVGQPLPVVLYIDLQSPDGEHRVQLLPGFSRANPGSMVGTNVIVEATQPKVWPGVLPQLIALGICCTSTVRGKK